MNNFFNSILVIFLGMNLNSHILLGIAVGIAFFHSPEIAILIGIGAALPDLDREYILTNKLSLAKHQLHRALFIMYFLPC